MGKKIPTNSSWSQRWVRFLDPDSDSGQRRGQDCRLNQESKSQIYRLNAQKQPSTSARMGCESISGISQVSLGLWLQNPGPWLYSFAIRGRVWWWRLCRCSKLLWEGVYLGPVGGAEGFSSQIRVNGKTHWKSPWCWEILRAEGEEGVTGGWDGSMTSPMQWTWTWENFGIWWGTCAAVHGVTKSWTRLGD